MTAVRRRRRLRRPLHALVLGAAAAVTLPLITAAPGQAATLTGGNPSGINWQVQTEPFSLSFRRSSTVVTEQRTGAAGPGARMSYQLDSGTRHTLTDVTGSTSVTGGTRYTVGTTESGRTAQVTVTTTTQGVRVALEFSPATDIAYVFEALSGDTDEHFLGSGMKAPFVDLKGKVVPIKNGYVGMSDLATCRNSTAQMPWYLSTRGYGFYVDNSYVGRFAFPGATGSGQTCNPARDIDPPPVSSTARNDRTQIGWKSPGLTYELYLGSFDEIMNGYTDEIGRPKLPPAAQFGLIQSRDLVADADQLLGDVEAIQSRNIPLAAVRVDNPWEYNPSGNTSITGACIGTFEWDTDRFPDPAGLIDEVHDRGVKFVTWIASFVWSEQEKPECGDPGYPQNSFVQGGINPQVPGSLDLDFTNPATVAEFQERLGDMVEEFGVDGIAGDRGEETNWEPGTFFAGSGREYHNQYPYLYAKAAIDELEERRGQDVLSVFRAGSVGSQSTLGALWAADQFADWEGLQLAIRMGLSASVSGYAMWGSDIGGYGNTNQNTPELFIRWAQLGAISPLYQVHGVGPNANFWNWGEPAVSRFRELTTLHYELFPYHYKLVKEANETGKPVLRPLGYQFPDDENAWAEDDQLMLGEDVLAAIVTTPGAKTHNTYLPEGQWVDLYDNRVLTGPSYDNSGTELSGFPLYLRRGAAIPFNDRNPDPWTTNWGINDLARSDRAGWLYAPGTQQVVEDSPFGGTLTAQQNGNTVTLSLSGAPAQTQIRVLTSGRPSGVSINGTNTAEAASLQALKGSRGWIYTEGQMRGITLKLAPTNGNATVTITLPS